MELRQLRYFLAVADELHFGRAAARLHISQPPLTVHIQRLEQELGVKLFDRSTRRVVLTQAGELFKGHVENLLEGLDEAVAELQDVRAGRRGRVRVGFVSSANYTLIPFAVRRFRELEPGIELVLHPLTSGEQIENLYEGKLDLGLIRDPELHAGLVFEELMTEELVAILPENHGLAQYTSVTPAQLVQEQMILFPYRMMPGFVSRVLAIFKPVGQIPAVAQRAVHQETVMGLVAAGVGISILPQSISGFHAGTVITRPISTAPRTSLMIVRPAPAPTPAVQAFLECLHDVVRRQSSIP